MEAPLKEVKQWSRGKSWAFIIGALLVPAVMAGFFDDGSLKRDGVLGDEEEALVWESPGEEVVMEEALGEEVKLEPLVEALEEAENEEIDFRTILKDDPTLEDGKTKVKVEGQKGEVEVKYLVTYTDGVETGREKVGEEVVKEAVDEVVLVGSKKKEEVVSTSSCGSGYYLNVDGICVKRPGSDPSGATAKCKDGSYSYSLHRRGTCSGHGGVREWL